MAQTQAGRAGQAGRWVAVAAVGIAGALLAQGALARDVYWSVGVGAPGAQVLLGNAPVYVAPPPVVVVRPPVYYRPAPVYYAPPPVVYAPRPVYYGPVYGPAYYGPPPGYRYGPGWGPRRGEGRWR